MTNTQLAGGMLIAGGALGAIYALIYTLWSGMAAIYGLSGLTYVLSMLMEFEFAYLLPELGGILMPFVQIIGFLLLFVLAGLTIYGGVVLVKGGPKQRVLLGCASAVALPVVGILVNYLGILAELTKVTTDFWWAFQSAMWQVVAGSAYNIPSFVLLVLELVVAGAAAWMVTRPEYGERE